MNRENLYSRRRFTAAAGTAALGIFAGCNRTDSSANGEPSNSSTDSPDYSLDFSIDNIIDISDLPVTELNSFNEIRDEDYIDFQYTVLEEGEEIDVDQLNLLLEGENNQNTVALEPGAQQIPCYELLEGRNTVTAKAEKDGEIVAEAADTTEKKTPDRYLIEGLVDGERITPYNSPYQFDTHNLNTEEFYQKRTETVENKARDDIIQNIDEERLEQEVLNNEELSERERKELAIKSVGIDSRDLIGNHSSWAEKQAASEEHALRHFTDYDEIYANGFDNPGKAGEEQGYHGTKMFYVDGDWYHSETTSAAITHVDGIQNVLTGTNSGYASIPGDFHEENVDKISHLRKIEGLNRFLIGMSNYEDIVFDSVMGTNEFGTRAIQMIQDNPDRGEVMPAYDIATEHHRQKEKHVSILGTPEEPVLLATDTPETNKRIKEDPGYQDSEIIINEALE